MRTLLVKAISILAIFAAMRHANAGPLVVAVLDSGFTKTSDKVPLCKYGLLDFTKSGSTDDSNPRLHGSNVIGLISQNAGSTGYCIQSLKIFKLVDAQVRIDVEAYYAALQYVIKSKPALINLSMAGNSPLVLEESLLKTILNNGTTVVAAAGNSGFNLNLTGCIVYPACADPRIYVIGNLGSKSSNLGGPVDTLIDGNNKKAAGVIMSGTSQAAAIFSGQVIKNTLRLQRKLK